MNVRELRCPKCNADAKLKISEHRKDTLFVASIVCEKCKSKIYQGFVDRSELNRLKILIRLKNMLKSVQTEQHKQKLLKRIEELENKDR